MPRRTNRDNGFLFFQGIAYLLANPIGRIRASAQSLICQDQDKILALVNSFEYGIVEFAVTQRVIVKKNIISASSEFQINHTSIINTTIPSITYKQVNFIFLMHFCASPLLTLATTSISTHHVLGATDVGILLRLAEVVPPHVPAAHTHLKVLVLLGMRLRVAQFLCAVRP